MSKPGKLLPALLAILIPSSVALAQQAALWQPTLDGAKRLAHQTRRLVLVYFHGDGCPACRAMEQQVFSQQWVMERLQAGYVPVKLNAEHFPSTAQQYGVTVLPTLVVIAPDGQPLDVIRGRMDAQPFLTRLEQVALAARRPSKPAAPTSPGWASPPTGGLLGSSGSSAPPVVATGTAPALSPPSAGIPNPPPGSPSFDDPRAAAGPWPTSPPGVAASPQVAGLAPGAAPGSQPGAVLGAAPSYPPRTVSGAAPNFVSAAVPGAATSAGLGMVPGAAPGAAPAAAPSATPGVNPPLGLEGYCPVSLVEQGKWIPGDRRWGWIHRGRTYLFAGPDEHRQFNTDPDRYAPVLGGNDVVRAVESGQMVPGYRRHGVFFGDRIYLFADEAALEKFSRDPNYYSSLLTRSAQAATEPTAAPRW